MILRLLAILFCSASASVADDRFRYYVFDASKTDKLHYELGYDFSISDHASEGLLPKLSFRTEYRIYGCAQRSFTYVEERCELEVSRERHQKLLAAIREMPLEKLKTDKEQVWSEGSSGSLDLDGKYYHINVGLNQPARVKLHGLIQAFQDEVEPKADRKITLRTIEGDFVRPLGISLEALLREPKKYDGKRVRVAGFYHGEFECSSFSLGPRAIFDGSVWLGSRSTFAKRANVHLDNDTYNTVEGTFVAGPSGHMGGYPGTIERLSKITKGKR